MGGFAFLGGFAAVTLGIGVIVYLVWQRLRQFSSRIFGTRDILGVLENMDTVAEETPRYLNGCDSLLLPKILKDFPDFDANHAKNLIRKYLKEKLGNKNSFTVHNVVIARYQATGAQKCIVFQAALSYREGNHVLQKRYDIHYSYILSGSGSTIAANCPNCGGPLGYGQRECPYCGSRVANPLGNVWEVTQLTET